jgi:hypothetical protein
VADNVQTSPNRLVRGSAVEVRNRFQQSFHNGFEVTRATRQGYRVRRLSDGAELPAVFSPDDVRADPGRRTGWI